jgi:hypothetical protein
MQNIARTIMMEIPVAIGRGNTRAQVRRERRKNAAMSQAAQTAIAPPNAPTTSLSSGGDV